MTALSQPLPHVASSSSSSSLLPAPAPPTEAEAAAAAAAAPEAAASSSLARHPFLAVILSPSVSLFPKSAHPSFLFSAGDQVEAQLEPGVWRSAEVVEMSSGGCGAGEEERQRYWKVSFKGLDSACDSWVALSDIRRRQQTARPQQRDGLMQRQTQQPHAPSPAQTQPFPSSSSSSPSLLFLLRSLLQCQQQQLPVS